MKMNNLLSNSKLFIKKNGSTILTCMGGAGVVATSVMAVKATPKALLLLEKAEEEKGEDLSKFEKVVVAGPAYIPSVLVGASTIACIFCANVMNKRQQASLMSAYAMLDSSYKEYKNKVKDIFGDEEGKVVEGIAQDKYDEDGISKDDDSLLFYDEFSGRFFNSTMDKVKQAQYEINRDLALQDSATINDFYEYLDIPKVDSGDDVGWSSGMNFDYYWQSWIDFSNLKTQMEDGTEYYILRMYQEPMVDYLYY
jgi:hypothetical protein